MHPNVREILYSREVIEERVKELAAQVLGVYREQDFTMAVTLKGAFIFAADLIRHLPEDVDVNFVWASSYGSGTDSNGEPALDFRSPAEWKGKHVLVVEDIVDTGHTAQALDARLRAAGAADVRICTFLDKPSRREVDVTPEFVGFTLDGSPFVVGYGLDHAGHYRNLPYIGVLDSAFTHG